MKVQCKLGVVLLNNDPGGLLHGLGPHTTLKEETNKGIKIITNVN